VAPTILSAAIDHVAKESWRPASLAATALAT
jgi:hypothetical protein